jgi:ribonuclease P protein component
LSRDPQSQFTLPRRERLRGAREFQVVFEGGSRVERAGFILLWQGGRKEQKVGFTVSRRVRGGVKRNLIRRRLREAYRRSKAHGPRGVRCVFVGRPALASASFHEIMLDVTRALDMVRARLPQEPPEAERR